MLFGGEFMCVQNVPETNPYFSAFFIHAATKLHKYLA